MYSLAWWHQAHHLSQCWPRSMLPYDIARQQWVKEMLNKPYAKQSNSDQLGILEHIQYWLWPSVAMKINENWPPIEYYFIWAIHFMLKLCMISFWHSLRMCFLIPKWPIVSHSHRHTSRTSTFRQLPSKPVVYMMLTSFSLKLLQQAQWLIYFVYEVHFWKKGVNQHYWHTTQPLQIPWCLCS